MSNKSPFSSDWTEQSNPYPAGSVAHWVVFHIKKTKSKPNPNSFPDRFFRVDINMRRPHRAMFDPYHERPDESWFATIQELAAETCPSHHCVLFPRAAFFTKEEHAVVFKLKASELIA